MGILIKSPSKEVLGKEGFRSVFLAGSITGAEDWQARAVPILLPYFNVVDPRRDNYNALDPKIEEEQITWEFERLRAANYVLFWFSHKTLAPITLFELGAKLMEIKLDFRLHTKHIAIGAHPDYKRRNDVIYQTQLLFPKLRVFSTLEDTCEQIIKNCYERDQI